MLALLLATALSGCGDATSGGAEPGPSAASPTVMLPADGPVQARATVLDDGHGPILCLGGVAMSLPPQCAGPEVLGWAWDDHPDHDAAGGVRWGEYTMVGTWDGTSFLPSDVRPTTPDDWPQEDIGALFATRCDEPEAGWIPVDPATTTRGALSAAHRVAEGLADYALSWGDQSINPRWQDSQELDGGEGSLEVEMAMNDPVFTILNVAVTDDLVSAEAEVRAVWGGSLCVSRVANTFERLRQVADELRDLPGNLGPQFGTISNRVDLPVIHDDGSIQAWADEEYGPGVVVVTSALEPVG